MEARTKKKEALLSLKMDIKIEKKKVPKIANLEYDRDLGNITEAKFRLQVRAILSLELEGATA